MSASFWKGKRVFLTGHTGFKGAWMAAWLTRLGAELTGFALAAPTRPSLYELAGLGSRLRHVEADIRDLEALRAAARQARPEIAIHMAAQSLVRKSYEAPVETYAVNALGTAHFLEAMRGLDGLRAMVVVTSDKCYQNREDGAAFKEDDPLGGDDPYSSSKAAAEIISAAYRRSFFSGEGPGIATARAGNVIGGGDWAADRLVPDLLRALEAGQSPEIRNPGSLRPWQHVLEPLSGYLALAQKLFESPAARSGAWNFGPDDSSVVPVERLARRLLEFWGPSPALRAQQGEHPPEARTLRLDSSKARSGLDWKPRWGLDQALRAVVQWHQAYMKGGDMLAMTLSQIDAYERAA